MGRREERVRAVRGREREKLRKREEREDDKRRKGIDGSTVEDPPVYKCVCLLS